MRAMGISRTQLVFNVALYYAGWLACVLGAAGGRWEAGAAIGVALVALHVGLAERRADEIRLIVVVTAIGYTVDSLQTAFGLLIFASAQPAAWLAPAWIAVMWMLFACTLRYAFAWLRGAPLLAALLGILKAGCSFVPLDPVNPSDRLEQMVADAGIELNDRHWQVIEFARKDNDAMGTPPGVRRITKNTDVSMKEIYQLFPKGPGILASKISGYGKPQGCV